ALRAACLARAGEPDDGAELRPAGRRRDHYRLKLAAQTHHGPPGALFYRDQFVDRIEPVLAAARDPYLVLLGPPALARALAARLPAPPFAVLGEIFAPGAVDLGPGRPELGGLRREDMAIRDRHPALWLARVRDRAAGLGVPVIPWSPADQRRLVAGVLRDPAALVVALPLRSGDPARDRDALLEASLGPSRTRAMALPLGLPPERLRAAVLEVGAADSPDIALWLAAGVAPHDASDLRAPDLVLAWGGAPGARAVARRRDELARGLAACRFRDAAWFPALAAALEAAYDPEAGVAEAPGAGPAPAAALEVVR
ncbi:MAG TPA: hypothetical protein VM891_08100, partial [Amaricoccus sp.]|nr:hypothetical protein [Amaricoccus sp.]